MTPDPPEVVTRPAPPPADAAPRWDLDSIIAPLSEGQLGAVLDGLVIDLHRLSRAIDAWAFEPAVSVTPATAAAGERLLRRLDTHLQQRREIEMYYQARVWQDGADETAIRGLTRATAVRGTCLSVEQLLCRKLAVLIGAGLLSATGFFRAHERFLQTITAGAVGAPQQAVLSALDLEDRSPWLVARDLLLASPDPPAPRPSLALTGPARTAPTPPPGTGDGCAPPVDAPRTALLAVAFNAIKREQLVAAEIRAQTPWTESLLRNGIPAPVWEQWRTADGHARTVLRRFLTAKIARSGRPGMSWAQVTGPLHAGEPLAWHEAVDLTHRGLTALSPSWGAALTRAQRGRWIDAAPRPRRRSTGLCILVRGDQSRLMIDFDGSYDAVFRLAHELGHCYHWTLLGHCTTFQRRLPLALAEIPSSLAELSLLSTPDRTVGANRTLLVEAAVVRIVKSVLGCAVRQDFETRAFARRAEAPLSVAELVDLTLESWRHVFGDTVSPDPAGAMQWAHVPHYFSEPFSAWPYSFAALAAAGIVSTRQDLGPGSGVDRFLRDAGKYEFATLSTDAGLSFDERFWRAAVAHLDSLVSEYEATTAGPDTR